MDPEVAVTVTVDCCELPLWLLPPLQLVIPKTAIRPKATMLIVTNVE